MEATGSLEALQALTRRLRAECPWDREQTATTIVPHTVEEAYEVADAAISGDPAKLADELGDLLFQVVFLALLLEEEGTSDLGAVITGVQEKLIRRHPHVFGDAPAETAGRVRERWETIKREQEGRDGVFHEIADAPTLNKKLKHDIDVVVELIDGKTHPVDSKDIAFRTVGQTLKHWFADRRAGITGFHTEDIER